MFSLFLKTFFSRNTQILTNSRCIIKNQDLLPTTPWFKLLQNDFWGTPLSHSGSHKSYRPLCILSFRMNYMVGGLNPVGYHLLNVILHGFVSCLFVQLSSRLFERDNELALFGGLFFALHPIHTGFDFHIFCYFLSSIIIPNTAFEAVRQTYTHYCTCKDLRADFFRCRIS